MINKNRKTVIPIIVILTTLIVILTITGAIPSLFLINQEDNHEFFHSKIFELKNDHDDGRSFKAENSEKGYEDENGKWATLQLSSSYSFGVRFINVTIPSEAEIKEAYVELYSTGSIEPLRRPNCKIYCDNVSNAVNFTTMGVLDISGRNYTDNYTTWNTTLPYGQWVKTPSIKSALQEVLKQEDWVSGNTVAVLFVSNGIKGYAATFDNYENDHPAKLYVSWK